MNVNEYEEIMQSEKLKKIVYFTISILAMVVSGIFYVTFLI